ncbi:MAG: AMP-binding protein, partial [Longispora sp.]|nr:AMP-binding protein [Longispora sp. (in: high G+C Gram-positive bacteria)]
MSSLEEPRNLADLLSRAAGQHPDRPALIAGNHSLTWSELDLAADSYARGLLSRGLTFGDRVGVSAPNTIELVATLFGIWRAGLIAVPVNPDFTPREREHVIGDSGAVLVVGVGGVPFGDVPVPGEPVENAGGGLAVLLYTSGTSGAPKGAMLTHHALLANHRQVERISPPLVQNGDVALLPVPLFHAYGLNCGLGAVAYHGATGVLVEHFDPVDTLGRLRRDGVTVLLGV